MFDLVAEGWTGFAYWVNWYADYALALWRDISPLGYVSICFAIIGVGWIFLSNSVK